jgi:hypothetical protein
MGKRIMTESRAEIVPALQMAGYLDPSHGLPDDFQDGVLQDLASAGIVKQITDGCYRDDTIDELVRMNKYQPYTLPHTELLVSCCASLPRCQSLTLVRCRHSAHISRPSNREV